MKIAEPNLLTLDYWRDEVSYQGITLPSGTIGCAALNIPDDVIDRLKQISLPLLAAVEAVNKLQLKPELLTPCRESILQMLELLQKESAFPLLDYPYYIKRIPEIFTEENMKKAEAYVKLAAMNLPAAMTNQLKSGLGLTKVITICAQLPDSLVMFKEGLRPLAQALHESDRAPEDYAAVFGEYFPEFPEFSLSEPSWMSLINVSMQYLSTIMPGKDAPQLVKRMRDAPIRSLRGTQCRPCPAEVPDLRKMVSDHRCPAYEILRWICTRRSEGPHLPAAWESARAGEAGAGRRSPVEGDL